MSKSAGVTLALSQAERERFESKALRTAGCRVWLGSIGADGYGRFALTRDGRKRVVSSHVLAAVLAWGGVPAGATVLHDCDLRLCVRTDVEGHLRISDQSENVRQAVQRGRSHGPLPGLVDTRGPAGASRAVRDALRASADRDPVALARLLREVVAAGDPLRDNLLLF